MQSHDNLTARLQADELERLVSSASVETILRQPGENRWSILQITCHLADAELLASVRIRRIITGDRAKMWGQTGEHNEYGVLSLNQLIEDYLAHTSKHLNQIEQLIGS
ncbi:MAG: DinB family protein [Blastocatellia bacterium]